MTLTADDTPTRTTQVLGDGHMWVMVLGDLVIFGAYFIIYMIYRAMHPQQFLESQQQLQLDVGVINTLLLLTSSFFVARSVQSARTGDHRQALRLTYFGGFCGWSSLRSRPTSGRPRSSAATPSPATSSSRSTTCSPACTCSTSPSDW